MIERSEILRDALTLPPAETAAAACLDCGDPSPDAARCPACREWDGDRPLIWDDDRVWAAVSVVATHHDEIGVDLLWRWVHAMSVTQADEVVRTVRDDYEARIAELERQLAECRQELANLVPLLEWVEAMPAIIPAGEEGA